MTELEINFRRGPDGEIIPLPLVVGMTAEECLERYKADAEAIGKPLQRLPKRPGRRMNGMLNQATSHVNGTLLRQALDGVLDRPEAVALRMLVVEQGEPMSLRPLYSQDDAYVTFRPVFQRVDEGQWRVGIEGQGKTKLIEVESPGRALEIAQGLVGQWYEEEETRLQDRARSAPRSLTSDYWARLIETLKVDEFVDLPNGWRITQGFSHNLYVLNMEWQSEDGRQMLRTRTIVGDPAVVVRAVLILAKSVNVPVPVPHSTQLIDLAVTAEPRIPVPKFAGESEGARTWTGGEDWELGWASSKPPQAGRWGVIRRKDRVLAELRLDQMSAGKGKTIDVVELRGLAKPFTGRTITKWDLAEFASFAQRPSMDAVAPLVWAMWELFIAQQRAAERTAKKKAEAAE